MCDPMSAAIATTAVSAGSTIMGFQGAKKDAKAQRLAANLNFAQDYNALAARGVQISQQRSEDNVTALIAKITEQGRISASAGALGLADPTVSALSNAAGFSIGRDASIAQLNADLQQQEVARDVQGARLGRDSRVKAAKGPSSLELVLGLGKAGLQGVNAYTSAGGKF